MSASVDAPGMSTLSAPASSLRLWGKGLPRALAAAEQRRRILAAVPAALAGRGFYHTFVSHVIEAAGASRPTFYEHFDNRQDVFRVAYDEDFGYLQAQIEAAYRDHAARPQKIAAAVAASLDFAVAEPLITSLLLVEPVASGATMSGRYYDCLDRLAPGPRRGRPSVPRPSRRRR